MNLAQERILVTGGAGFVGACLLRALIAQGAQVDAIIPQSTNKWRIKDINQGLVIHDIDITDATALTDLVNRLKPTIIYHLAANGAYAVQNDPKKIINTNVMGTLNLLQALEGVPYRLLVNVGSSSEYGFKSVPMKEDQVLVPNSFYSVAKSAQSLLCQYWAKAFNKPIVTFRLFSVYGPYEEPTRLVPTIVAKALKQEPLTMVSKDTVRDFVYVDDIIRAFLMIEALEKYPGHIFNLCSGQQTTLGDMVDELLVLTRLKVDVHWGQMPARRWDAQSWVGDPQLTAELLGWRAEIALTEGLTKMIEWMKTNGCKQVGV